MRKTKRERAALVGTCTADTPEVRPKALHRSCMHNGESQYNVACVKDQQHDKENDQRLHAGWSPSAGDCKDKIKTLCAGQGPLGALEGYRGRGWAGNMRRCHEGYRIKGS